MRASKGVMIVTVAAVGGTAVIFKAIFSVIAVAISLAMNALKVVILLIVVAVIFVVIYFMLKRRSRSRR